MRGIYCFTNTINGKQYIGQSMRIEERYKEHKRKYNYSKSSMYTSAFYQALRKYGFDNFKFEILESNNNFTKDDLNKLESAYIKNFNTYYSGYNMNFGGDSVYVHRKLKPEEVKEIKRMLKDTKISMINIAKKYHVVDSLISQINEGKIWIKENEKESFPIRKDTYFSNKGGTNPNAILTDADVMAMRKRYVNEQLNDIYKDYQDKVSWSTVKKVLYGVQFKHLPIYKKRQKKWYLNGTCIDYPRIEE